MSEYQYEPLSARGEIRVLQVHPGPWASAVDCSLKRVSLADDEREEYDAISYAWEGQSPSKSIRVDEQSLLVTYNAFSAIKHLRLEDEPRNLWIDAVCINQQSNGEKGHQVAQMRDVFHGAENVIVWLGDGDDYSMEAMNWIKAQTEYCSYPPWQVLSMLWDILQRPWWNRIWVLQEVVAARRSPTVKCGREEIPWDKLRCVERDTSAIDELRQVLEVEPPLTRVGYVTLLNLVKRLREPDQRLSWREAFALRVTMESTHQKDLTYAILSLLPERVQSQIEPDYARDDMAVLQLTMKVAICTDFALETLTLTTQPFHPQWPSWVPDLDNGTATLFCGQRDDVFNTGGSSDRDVSFASNDKVMFVLGTMVDRISAVATETNLNPRHSIDISQSRSLALRCGARVGLNNNQIFERFWRTLIMNCGRSITDESPFHRLDYPAPKDYGERYMALYEEAEVPAEANFVEGVDAEARRIRYTKPYSASMNRSWDAGRARFFTTDKGWFGLAQDGIEPGDAVCIFAGGKVMFVLREYRDGHRIVGCAYLHGHMDGESAHLLSDPEKSCKFKIY